jgi:hypothetical protein
MANAFFSLSHLAAVFRGVLAALSPSALPSPHAAGSPSAPAPARARPAQPAALKPLRVVRVLEPSAPRSTAGRMVISGRLADVCAELDRLAALEAQGC